jgi:hypothetical protein
VRAVSRTCRPGGFTLAIHWPEHLRIQLYRR